MNYQISGSNNFWKICFRISSKSPLKKVDSTCGNLVDCESHPYYGLVIRTANSHYVHKQDQRQQFTLFLKYLQLNALVNTDPLKWL